MDKDNAQTTASSSGTFPSMKSTSSSVDDIFYDVEPDASSSLSTTPCAEQSSPSIHRADDRTPLQAFTRSTENKKEDGRRVKFAIFK